MAIRRHYAFAQGSPTPLGKQAARHITAFHALGLYRAQQTHYRSKQDGFGDVLEQKKDALRGQLKTRSDAQELIQRAHSETVCDVAQTSARTTRRRAISMAIPRSESLSHCAGSLYLRGSLSLCAILETPSLSTDGHSHFCRTSHALSAPPSDSPFSCRMYALSLSLSLSHPIPIPFAN